MLAHKKKLKKLWNKTKKIKKGGTLDRRFKSTKEFTDELKNILKL